MSQAISINITKLLFSRVTAQVLMLITTPVVTRLFLPEHFGVMQIFESIITPFCIIANLKYDQSIPLGKNQQEASASLILSLFFAVNMTACSFAGILIGKDYIARWFHAPDLARFLWLLPAFVFIVGLNNVLNSWASREGKFGIMALSGLGDTVGDKTLTIVWGYLLRASTTGLVLGRFVGVFTNAVALLWSLGKTLFTDVKNAHLTLATIRAIAVQHKKFPLFSTWIALIASINIQLPSLICGLYFSPAVVGYYSLANRVVSVSSIFLGTVIAQVFFPAAAKEYHQTGTFSPIVRTILRRLVQIGVFPMAVLVFFGPSLFIGIFGQQWSEAGIYAEIMASWHFLIFLNLSLDIFALVNRQDLDLMIVLTGLIVRTIVLFASVTFGSPRITLGLFVFFSVIFLIGQLFWKLRISHISSRWASTLFLKYSALSCALLLPAKWFSWILNDVRVDFVAVLIATGGYVAVLLMFEPELQQFIVTVVRRLKGMASNKTL
ncbi:polysaccharide biosynthesis protein [Candidatus Vecturithrix granuli]|uniref:Polysaccharide biosynthesis protein n=1 Tax=Vecturithrix granuli TaxID=1499967 RepID=A0A081BX26_VECG1|nr:polysaccharide biosynthesis protein [Candidatus Vecturithrix granuli]